MISRERKFEKNSSVVEGKIALFFGAGASAPFGLPVMRKSVEILKEQIEEKITHGSNGALRLIKRVINTYFEKERNFTFEELMEIIHRIKELNYEFSILDFLVGRIDAIKNVVHQAEEAEKELKRFIFETYSNIVDNEKINSIYSNIFSEPIEKNLKWIFTTNYDNIIEKYIFEKYKERISDGFDGSRFWTGFDLHNNEKIFFAKMHGSLNWVRNKETGIIEKVSIPVIPANPNIALETILYPFRKTFTTIQPFFSLFNLFDKALNEATHFIFIGYSFSDELIYEMVKFTYRRRKNDLKIIIIDPNADIIRNKVVNSTDEKNVLLLNKKIEDLEKIDISNIFK